MMTGIEFAGSFLLPGLEDLHQPGKHLEVERLWAGHGHFDAAEQIPVRPEVGAQAWRQRHDGVLRPAAADGLLQVGGQVEHQISEWSEVVRREVIADGEVCDERVLNVVAIRIRDQEADPSAQYELRPRVPPELPVRGHGAKAVAVVFGAGRHAHRDVERLGEVAALGNEEAGRDLEVTEARMIVAARHLAVRGDERNIISQLEPGAEGGVQRESGGVLVAIGVAIVVGEAAGEDAEPVEHTVERVEPALPRGPALSRGRTRPGPVPALAKECSRRERLPLRGLRVDIAEERLAGSVEQAERGLPSLLCRGRAGHERNPDHHQGSDP